MLSLTFVISAKKFFLFKNITKLAAYIYNRWYFDFVPYSFIHVITHFAPLQVVLIVGYISCNTYENSISLSVS